MQFTQSFLGGLLIGASAIGLLFTHGRLSGISGILGGVLRPTTRREEWPWKAAFAAGLLVSGGVLGWVLHASFTEIATHGVAWLALAGFVAGFGARLGGGCTSGHGICGIGSLSIRSVVATVVFMLTGAITVFVAKAFL